MTKMPRFSEGWGTAFRDSLKDALAEKVQYRERTYKTGFALDPQTGLKRPLTSDEIARWERLNARAMLIPTKVKK